MFLVGALERSLDGPMGVTGWSVNALNSPMSREE